ncbi:MAG TPA: ABC transporter [Mycobacteriales bacterium]|nr:ABC transporter [Mycobacteriales bacterium]
MTSLRKDSPRVPEALEALRTAVAGVRLGLATPGAAAAGKSARAIVTQIDDYLLPRLRQLDAPLLTVVGGSTGAGKSTLVNSVLGAEVSPAGVLRPTTRAPVLVCAPADREWFAGDRVLPSLARLTGAGADAGAGALRLVDLPQLPVGLALLDAPDVDSVVTANRDLSAQLLAAADLWVFVTTAARYADAVPWDLLRTAQERATALAVVLDRVPPGAAGEIADDLRGMLTRAGLPSARLFVVEERPLTAGRLPEDQVAPLRDWLHGLAADAEARAAVVRQTLSGALDSLTGRVAQLVEAVAAQEAAARALTEAGTAAYDGARDEVDDGVRSGTLLRGEVLARWQDFVGTGEWMRGLESRVGRLRDRITAAITGRAQAADDVAGALEGNVETLLRAAADRAAERTATAWRGTAGGAALLAGRERELERASEGFGEAAAREVRAWQGRVLELVQDEGQDKRSTARVLSYGVNGAGLAVMVGVFAQTGGLTGTEVAVAGGTSAVGQKVLEAVFGDAAVRALAAQARQDLAERTDRLLAAERARYTRLVEEAVPAPDTATGLRVALAALAVARREQA